MFMKGCSIEFRQKTNFFKEWKMSKIQPQSTTLKTGGHHVVILKNEIIKYINLHVRGGGGGGRNIGRYSFLWKGAMDMF